MKINLFKKIRESLFPEGTHYGDDSKKYTEEDIARLERHWQKERESSGKGPFGTQKYDGYRGLKELPWFELDDKGRLKCIMDDLPPIIDIHTHLGFSLFLAPDIDLHARTPRVRHFLDCDGKKTYCEYDLDVYMNANFTPSDLRSLTLNSLAQGFYRTRVAATHTIPNLLNEMDACHVSQALVLPIAINLPFKDNLTERWMDAIHKENVGDRLLAAASVHPRDPKRIIKLRKYAEQGVYALKLHPVMQRFFPDTPGAMDIYEECERRKLPVLFHAGRAGIEPSNLRKYALMRHYEGALRSFPNLRFIFGHSGARDVEDAIALAKRYENVWMDIHGQGVTMIHEMIRQLGKDRLLFGTDWPFYHLAPSLAKVLIVTEGHPDIRYAILHGNAKLLLKNTLD